jgi:hypothetical protein
VGANPTRKMGLRVDTTDELQKETATKIHGEPMDHNITLLKKELIAIAATSQQHSKAATMAM